MNIRDVKEPILARALDGNNLMQEIVGGKCSTFGNGLKFYSIFFPEIAFAVRPYTDRQFGYASNPAEENISFATKKDGGGERCCGITFNKDVDKKGRYKSKVRFPNTSDIFNPTNIAAKKGCTEEGYNNSSSLEKFSEIVYRVKKSMQKKVNRGEDVSWPYSEVVCRVKTEPFTPSAIIINLDNPQSLKDTKTLRDIYAYKQERPEVAIYTYKWECKFGKTSNLTEVRLVPKFTRKNINLYGDDKTKKLLAKRDREREAARSAKKDKPKNCRCCAIF